MSITIDTEIEGEVYDQEFDENHTIDDEMVASTCTYTGTTTGGCLTCE